MGWLTKKRYVYTVAPTPEGTMILILQGIFLSRTQIR